MRRGERAARAVEELRPSRRRRVRGETLSRPCDVPPGGTAAIAAGKVNPLVPVYLNRLSDLLFILARAANGGDEVLWRPGS